MSITTMDGLVAAMDAGMVEPLYKASMTAKAAGTLHSLWLAGGNPSAGVANGSTTANICTNATAGAVPISNPAGKGYLGRLSFSSSTAGSLAVYDRLAHNSGLSGTATTAQAMTFPALTRYTDGLGVEAWIEIYTATGTTGVTATLTYVDADDVTKTATAALPASPVPGQIIPFNYAAGCKGIKSITSIQLSATTGTTGNFGITLAKRLADIPIPVANIGTSYDAISLGMPEIKPNACLAFACLCTATNTGALVGSLLTLDG